MTRFFPTLIGALIGALMFAVVGVGMAHAQAGTQQGGARCDGAATVQTAGITAN
jgi:hypothetical protein